MVTSIALLLLRLTVGIIFLLHGAQKLFGVLGGHGLNGTTQFMENLGLRPARFWAIVGAIGEFLGGLLVVLGFLTPIGALLVTGVMLVAIAKVHWPKGFWNMQGGYEYNLVLGITAVALGLMGAGTWSLDAVLGWSALSATFFVVGLVVVAIVLLIAIPAGNWIAEHSGFGRDRMEHPASV
jgi:putative oxidoreductase